jgi:hypothetical protein
LPPANAAYSTVFLGLGLFLFRLSCLSLFFSPILIFLFRLQKRPGLHTTQITWTERQNSRCVHGFRGPNARTLIAFTDSVDRTPALSLCVHGFRGPNARSIAFTDSVIVAEKVNVVLGIYKHYTGSLSSLKTIPRVYFTKPNITLRNHNVC